MKKLLALCLTAVLCFFGLASCGKTHKENTWLSEEKLTNCLVSDLPAIEKDYINHNGEDIYVSFTSKEREAYAADILEYLKSQNFKYLGTRGEQKNTLAGVFTTYYFEPANELSSFLIEGNYIFVFSDGTVDENGDVKFNLLIIYSVSTNTLEYGNKKFTYNTKISLRQGSEAPLSGFYVLKDEEHEHIDKNNDRVCDVCGYDNGHHGFAFEYFATEEGHCEHKVGTDCDGTCAKSPHENWDADTFCDICGYEMSE